MCFTKMLYHTNYSEKNTCGNLNVDNKERFKAGLIFFNNTEEMHMFFNVTKEMFSESKKYTVVSNKFSGNSYETILKREKSLKWDINNKIFTNYDDELKDTSNIIYSKILFVRSDDDVCVFYIIHGKCKIFDPNIYKPNQIKISHEKIKNVEGYIMKETNNKNNNNVDLLFDAINKTNVIFRSLVEKRICYGWTASNILTTQGLYLGDLFDYDINVGLANELFETKKNQNSHTTTTHSRQKNTDNVISKYCENLQASIDKPRYKNINFKMSNVYAIKNNVLIHKKNIASVLDALEFSWNVIKVECLLKCGRSENIKKKFGIKENYKHCFLLIKDCEKWSPLVLNIIGACCNVLKQVGTDYYYCKQ